MAVSYKDLTGRFPKVKISYDGERLETVQVTAFRLCDDSSWIERKIGQIFGMVPGQLTLEIELGPVSETIYNYDRRTNTLFLEIGKARQPSNPNVQYSPSHYYAIRPSLERIVIYDCGREPDLVGERTGLAEEGLGLRLAETLQIFSRK